MLCDINVVRLAKGLKEEITYSFFIVKGEVNLVRKSNNASPRKHESFGSRDEQSEETTIKQKSYLEINEFNEDLELTATKDSIIAYFGKVTNVDSKEKYQQSALFKNSFLIMNNARQVEANFEDIDRKSIRASFNNVRQTTRVNQ